MKVESKKITYIVRRLREHEQRDSSAATPFNQS